MHQKEKLFMLALVNQVIMRR